MSKRKKIDYGIWIVVAVALYLIGIIIISTTDEYRCKRSCQIEPEVADRYSYTKGEREQYNPREVCKNNCLRK